MRYANNIISNIDELQTITINPASFSVPLTTNQFITIDDGIDYCSHTYKNSDYCKEICDKIRNKLENQECFAEIDNKNIFYYQMYIVHKILDEVEKEYVN